MTVYDVARRLPSIADLRNLCRSQAMLDAISSPDWEGRCHCFDAGWADGEEMASMRNGSGDGYSIVFSVAGACVRGFDHEAPMSPYGNGDEPWPGVIDGVAEVFKPFVEEPAFTEEDDVPVVTACLWREAADDRWRPGVIDFPAGCCDPDGQRACSRSWSTARRKRLALRRGLLRGSRGRGGGARCVGMATAESEARVVAEPGGHPRRAG